MALAGHMNKTQCNIAHHHGVCCFQRPHDKSHQVGGHDHRVGEPRTCGAVTEILAANFATVGHCHEVAGKCEVNGKHGFEIGFVKAGECATAIGALHLSRGNCSSGT